MKRLSLLLLLVMQCAILSAQLDRIKVNITDGTTNTTLKSTIEQNASSLLESFNKAIITGKKPAIGDQSITKSAKDEVLSMWKSSAMACPLTSINEHLLTLPGGGYQIRNIGITLLDAPSDQQDQELVINFDAQGRIDNVLVAMEKERYVDVIGSNISVADFSRRQVIVDFVENFRTAYNRKDLPYLKTVFSDDAIIITGKIIKAKVTKGDTPQLNTEHVVYTKQTKKEYLDGLARCFKNNKYIDVVFDDIEVTRHPVHENIYGVTLKQDWRASRYNDTGYVFLMIDFTDEMQPCIQVRTWQPEKYDGRTIDRDEIFSLESFDI